MEHFHEAPRSRGLDKHLHKIERLNCRGAMMIRRCPEGESLFFFCGVDFSKRKDYLKRGFYDMADSFFPSVVLLHNPVKDRVSVKGTGNDVYHFFTDNFRIHNLLCAPVRQHTRSSRSPRKMW